MSVPVPNLASGYGGVGLAGADPGGGRFNPRKAAPSEAVFVSAPSIPRKRVWLDGLAEADPGGVRFN